MIQLIQTYHLTTYDSFKNELVDRYTLLTEFTRALSDITPFSPSISKFLQIGFVMKNYYALFSQTDLNELLEYSFGFNAPDIFIGVMNFPYLETTFPVIV